MSNRTNKRNKYTNTEQHNCMYRNSVYGERRPIYSFSNKKTTKFTKRSDIKGNSIKDTPP